MKQDKVGNYMPDPYEQRGYNSLCTVYSMISAVRMIRGLTYGESRNLYFRIVNYLDETMGIAQILTKGISFRTVEDIFKDVIGDQLNRSLPFLGQPHMKIEEFLPEIEKYFYDRYSKQRSDKIVLLCIKDVSDYWAIFRDTVKFPDHGINHFNYYKWHSCHSSEIDKLTTLETSSRQFLHLNPARTYLLW